MLSPKVVFIYPSNTSRYGWINIVLSNSMKTLVCAYIRLLHVGLFSVCVCPCIKWKLFFHLICYQVPSLQWHLLSFYFVPLWQFEDVGTHGTKVIIYNLWLNSDAKLELDFDSVAEVNILYLYVSDFLFIAKYYHSIEILFCSLFF